MVLLDQPLIPWFARLKVPELPLGQETSLVYFHRWLCAQWHFTVPLSGSRAEMRYNFSIWKYLLPGRSHRHPPLTRAPSSSASLGYATRWGWWGRVKHGSCGTQVCQACNTSASSMWVPLPCAKHSESEQLGAKPVSRTRAWEPIPPNKCYPPRSLCRHTV